ncbi:MAG: intradiol ring-cleavage dioxygenase [Solirubrobacterales bacterium]|nr:intradiol ring-cleavage dioxygenase [Solirubrobacterales bacterium]
MSTRNLADEELTQAVLSSFSGCRSERFQEIIQSLVRHLHAFASDVELTEEEWFAGIDFLTQTGHITDDKRQEFILLSDVLGVSMLVVGLNHRKPSVATPSTVFGPFFVEGSPRVANGEDIANGAPGEPCLVQGRVISMSGEAVPQAHIEVWQADDDGLYDVQHADLSEPRGRGHLYAGDDGRYCFWSVKPTAYPIPADGPVGKLLANSNRSPMRPAHIHFMVTARGYQSVTTHVFADGDPYLDSDAVFGVKSELIAPLTRHQPGRAADGRDLDVPYWSINYDIVLALDDASDMSGRAGGSSRR